MSSHVWSCGSRQQILWRTGTAMLLALLAAIFTAHTSQAAPLAQAIEPCIQPASATIVDPVGGAIQVRMYSGASPINVENYPTSLQRIELEGGGVIYAFCINSNQARRDGVRVCVLSPIDDVRVAYLIAKYPPDFQNNINQAARQAALWHFSNGINLDLTDPTTAGPVVDAAVVSQYSAILAEVSAIDPANPPAIFTPGPVALSVDPVAAINQLPTQPSHPITVTLTKGGVPLPGIQVQVASNFGLFNQTTATTDANGEATFTISSNVAGTANIVASAVVTIPEALEYVVQAEPTLVQPFGIPSSIVETVTATASKEWRMTPPPPPGRITLTKNVQGTAAGEQWAFSFTLDGGSLRTATNAVQQVTWEDLVPDRTYILQEADPGSDWTVGSFACTLNGAPVGAVGADGFEIPVTPGADISCSITNTKVPPGQITLTKQVIGTEEDWSFTFRLDGAALPDERVATKASPQAIWSGLTPSNTYTLTEVAPGADWQVGSFACTVNGTPIGTAGSFGIQIPITPGANVVCTMDNTRIPPPPETGAITVTKSVVGTTENWAFGFTLNGANPRTATQAAPSVVWSNLDPGNYVLQEIEPGAGWSVGVFSCSVNGQPVADANGGSAGFAVVVAPDDSVECSMENTRLPDTGSITLTKEITRTEETSWAFSFQLTTLDGSNPQVRVVTNEARTTVWNDLTPGVTYSLSEQAPGAPWEQGRFECTLNGQLIAVADNNAPIILTVNSGDNVICSKNNLDTSGTDLAVEEEPAILSKKLYLPMVNQ